MTRISPSLLSFRDHLLNVIIFIDHFPYSETGECQIIQNQQNKVSNSLLKKTYLRVRLSFSSNYFNFSSTHRFYLQKIISQICTNFLSEVLDGSGICRAPSVNLLALFWLLGKSVVTIWINTLISSGFSDHFLFIKPFSI